MAKNMALISNGTVENILWYAAWQEETDTLVNTGDYPVEIGDSYIEGKFYRDGKEILTPFEDLQIETERLYEENHELIKENNDLLATTASLVEDIYQSDLTILE